jgi:transcriptional regulator with XRE-family HTH domain
LDHLKKATARGVSVYAIAKATGISQPAIGRFLSGERKQIRSDTIDKLSAYFGLELRPAKSTAGVKTRKGH